MGATAGSILLHWGLIATFWRVCVRAGVHLVWHHDFANGKCLIFCFVFPAHVIVPWEKHFQLRLVCVCVCGFVFLHSMNLAVVIRDAPIPLFFRERGEDEYLHFSTQPYRYHYTVENHFGFFPRMLSYLNKIPHHECLKHG